VGGGFIVCFKDHSLRYVVSGALGLTLKPSLAVVFYKNKTIYAEIAIKVYSIACR